MNEIKLIIDGNEGDLLIVCRNMKEAKMVKKLICMESVDAEILLKEHGDVSFRFYKRSWNGWSHKSWYLTEWSHKKFEVLNLTQFLHSTFIEVDI